MSPAKIYVETIIVKLTRTIVKHDKPKVCWSIENSWLYGVKNEVSK